MGVHGFGFKIQLIKPTVVKLNQSKLSIHVKMFKIGIISAFEICHALIAAKKSTIDLLHHYIFLSVILYSPLFIVKHHTFSMLERVSKKR